MRFTNDGATVLENEFEFIEAYLDWKNDFLTVSRFAEYYGWSEEQAKNVIETGRTIHRQITG